ncbi:MAG: chaperone NapD [Gammaproteobacteria bacterium]|nr:chaperone NapD [Gammaproteobacteria bacterium]
MTAPSCHVVGAIARVQPASAADVRRWVEREPGAEVATSNEEGTLVLVLEGPDDAAVVDIMERLRNEPGVLDVQFVYHQIVEGAEAPA